MRPVIILVFLIAATFLASPPVLHAAAIPNVRRPDIGSAMQEAQSARPAPIPQRQTTDIGGEAPGKPSDAGGATIHVNDFRLENVQFIKEAEIRKILEPYRNRDLTLGQLEEVTAKVTELYRQKGYVVARAYLPKQKAADGVITIRILVGSYGPTGLENSSAVRDWLLERSLRANLAEGRPVHRSDLERAVLIIGDMPGAAQPTLSMGPGQTPGTTDFFAQVPKGKRVGAFLMSDNMGSRYTGRWRFGGGAEANSPLGLADKLSIFGLTSDTGGLKSFAINYAFPLSANGLRLDLGYSRVDYRLGEDFEDLEARGKSDVFEGTLSYPIVRSATHNLYASLNVARKNMEDRYDVFDFVRRKQSTLGKLSLRNENWFTVWGLPVYARVGAGFTYGNFHFPQAEDREEDAEGYRYEGDFTYLSAEAMVNVSFTERFSLSLSAAGQKSLGKNLDSSEQLNVTGSNGVKAYRESISGDNGYVFNAEFRYRLPDVWKVEHYLGAFVDQGGWNYQRPIGVVKHQDALTDIGLGYYLTCGPLSVKAQLYHAIGTYPEELKREPQTGVSLLFMLNF
ncbi:MAG: hypothetical protein LBR22_10335 [Desulfovibrio sp.]|jgi:hemolysin activation/secretion protein|nr:hypothetical protein [Desulfovibrio sp.]